MFDYHRLRISVLKGGQHENTYSLRGPVAGIGAVWWMFSVFLGEALRNEYAVLALIVVCTLFLLAYVTEDYPRFGRLIVGAVALVLSVALIGFDIYGEQTINWQRIRSSARYEQIVAQVNQMRWFVVVGSSYLWIIGALGIRNHFVIRQQTIKAQK